MRSNVLTRNSTAETTYSKFIYNFLPTLLPAHTFPSSVRDRFLVVEGGLKLSKGDLHGPRILPKQYFIISTDFPSHFCRLFKSFSFKSIKFKNLLYSLSVFVSRFSPIFVFPLIRQPATLTGQTNQEIFPKKKINQRSKSINQINQKFSKKAFPFFVDGRVSLRLS